MNLWMRKIAGCPDDVGILSLSIPNMAPEWFLHGMTALPQDQDGDEDTYTACIWGEGDFTLSGEYLETGVWWSKDPITDSERARVFEDAAYAAAKIVLLKDNYKEWAEALLNKHPECRVGDNDYEAIISAALEERKQMFTDEDYERF